MEKIRSEKSLLKRLSKREPLQHGFWEKRPRPAPEFGRRRGCLPRLGRASGERRTVFPGKQNQPAACIPSPLLRILTMFSKKTTGGIENESNWDRAAHRRLSYNRDKSERLENTGVSLILSNFTSIQAKLNDCGGLQPHIGKEDGSIKLNNRESPGIALRKSIAQSRTIPGLIFLEMEVFKMFSSGCSVAFEALMQETPYDHFDSGCDGICPECRSCLWLLLSVLWC